MTTSKQIPSVHDAVPEPVRNKPGELAESGENYLETILVMKARKHNGYVRAVDLANELGFSKPSVSRALGLLKEKELIKICDNGDLELTPEGRKTAEHVFKRHQLLTVLLQEVAKVPFDIAERDACRIEHVVSDETMKGIKAFLKERELI